MKKLVLGLVISALALTLVACNDETKTTTSVNDKTYSSTSAKKEENKVAENKFGDINRYADVQQNPIVTMKIKDGGEVKIELYPKIAPSSVENFISLINKGFYDGLIFHRVMPNFMAQGGDPSGDGTGGPGYYIVGEFNENGFKNELSHDIGVISMARATPMDSAGSQFFIVTSESSKASLDGLYAGFGKVIEGMDEVYKVVNVPVNYATEDLYALYPKLGQENAEFTEEEINLIKAYQAGEAFDRPIDPPVIEKMTVDTFGVTYAEPIKAK